MAATVGNVAMTVDALATHVQHIHMDVDIDVTGLLHEWPQNHPVVPAQGVVIIRAQNWRAWLAQIRAGTLVANNDAQAAPNAAVPVPAANELHPWAGYHNLDVATGLAVPQRVGRVFPVTEVIAILAALCPAGARRRTDIMNLLVLGVTIITSRGNITQARLRRTIQAATRETLSDIDMTRDPIIQAWDFLNANWGGNQVGHQFQMMFEMFGRATQVIALRLGLMCQQTQWKMLTGIVTTIRAINRFQDFPWQDMFDTIAHITGNDEAATILAFANYIDPPAPPAGQAAAAAAPAGGHWAGWEFALRTQNQGQFRNPMFINTLYCALQLSIQVGGNLSLRGYGALDNATVPVKGVIDTWVAAYLAQRGVNCTHFRLRGAGQVLQDIRAQGI